MRKLKVEDWIMPGTLVLSLMGRLDHVGCKHLSRQVEELQACWPGIRLTIDLSGVSEVDPAVAEGLLLRLVAGSTREGSLTFACPSLACLSLLRRLNIDFSHHLPTERPLAGVTA